MTQNISHAKTQEKLKTVKFHKAETEAEKALDRILKMQYRIIQISHYFPEEDYHQFHELIKINPDDCLSKYYTLEAKDDKEFCRTMLSDNFMQTVDDLIKDCINRKTKDKYAKYSCRREYDHEFFVHSDDRISYYTISSTDNVSCIHYVVESNISYKERKKSSDSLHRNMSNKSHKMVKIIRQDNNWKIDMQYRWYDFFQTKMQKQIIINGELYYVMNMIGITSMTILIHLSQKVLKKWIKQ